jgi:hypothetical protein
MSSFEIQTMLGLRSGGAVVCAVGVLSPASKLTTVVTASAAAVGAMSLIEWSRA